MSRPKVTSRISRTGPLLTRSSSGSTGIQEPLRTASSIRPEVCSLKRQIGKHANTTKKSATNYFLTCAEASPAERVPLHDWDVHSFRILLGAWQWKPEAPTPKCRTLSKARFLAAMDDTLPQRGATMDFGRLCARLATPQTDVKSGESGKVDVLNIQVMERSSKGCVPPMKIHKIPLRSRRRLEQTWFCCMQIWLMVLIV